MTSGTLDNSEDSPRGFGHGISDRQQGVSKMGLGRRLSMCDRYAVGDLEVHVLSLPLIEKGPSARLEEL